MVSKALFSSEKKNWRTPPWIFEKLKIEGHWVYADLAADYFNRVVPLWTDDIERDLARISFAMKKYLEFNLDAVAFCNPPYGRKETSKFVKICAKADFPVIMLLPARTDTKWFHEHIYKKDDVRIEFISGRIKFIDPDTGEEGGSSTFPSMLVYFRC